MTPRRIRFPPLAMPCGCASTNGCTAAWPRPTAGGQPALSRRELRDFHNECTGEWLEISSVASTVNALVAAKRVEEVEARACSLPPHRLVKPVRCRLQQATLTD